MKTSDDALNVLEETEAPEEAASLTSDEEEKMKAMMEAGVFYGYTKPRTHPKNKPYIISTRAGVQVIDLVKTMECLKAAALMIKDAVKSGGLMLLVGTTPSVKSAVKASAERLGLPHVTERWLGGTLTNFTTISGRINYFKKLKEDKASGGLDKYTKKERVLLDEKLAKLDKFFSGVETLDRLPSLVLIVDLKAHEIAAREAKRMGIPVVGFLNTNADPDLADCPVPVNTRSAKSVEFLMSYLSQEVERARSDVQNN